MQASVSRSTSTPWRARSAVRRCARAHHTRSFRSHRGRACARQALAGGAGPPLRRRRGPLPTTSGSLPATFVTVLHTPGHARTTAASARAGDLLRRSAAGGRHRRHPRKPRRQPARLPGVARRVRALSPARLLPAHGPTIDDPDALIERYVRHRAEREPSDRFPRRVAARREDIVVAHSTPSCRRI